MKLTINEIRKGTCKLLSTYFGLGIENILRKADQGASAISNLQTPDSYSGRVNSMFRKHPSNRYPQ